MNIIDKAISYFSPAKALKRLVARTALETRAYDASSTKRRVENWKTLNSSANTEIGQAQQIIRNRVRDLRRNSPYCAKLIQGIATNTIGTGFLARFGRSSILRPL